MLPRCSSGQQQNRDISATDQQQQSYGREQQVQCPADITYEVVIQSFYGHAEMLREMRRSLLCELFDKRLELRVSRRARDPRLEPNHREVSAHRIGSEL